MSEEKGDFLLRAVAAAVALTRVPGEQVTEKKNDRRTSSSRRLKLLLRVKCLEVSRTPRNEVARELVGERRRRTCGLVDLYAEDALVHVLHTVHRNVFYSLSLMEHYIHIFLSPGMCRKKRNDFDFMSFRCVIADVVNFGVSSLFFQNFFFFFFKVELL